MDFIAEEWEELLADIEKVPRSWENQPNVDCNFEVNKAYFDDKGNFQRLKSYYIHYNPIILKNYIET